MQVIATNKKARHDYFLQDTYEAGIVLQGSEIKSIRQGKVNFVDAYAYIRNGEAFLMNMHISIYKEGNRFNHEETRTRKLLLHKREILKIEQKIKQDSLTLIPIKIYLDHGLCKVEIALAKGKKMYDKRQSLKEKDAKRRMQKGMSERY
jgi:SsrA-binding protein